VQQWTSLPRQSAHKRTFPALPVVLAAVRVEDKQSVTLFFFCGDTTVSYRGQKDQLEVTRPPNLSAGEARRWKRRRCEAGEGVPADGTRIPPPLPDPPPVPTAAR